MSRIQDALQRTGRDTAPGADQGVFASAWAEPQAEPATERERLPTPLPRGPQLAPAGNVSTISLTSSWRERLATADGDPILVEQFRRLAAALHHAQQAGAGLKSVMVTSASPNDGKTLTAVNLALVMSGSYNRRVLLIDADLRRPSLGNLTDLSDAVGLSEALKAPTEQKLAVLQVTPNLLVLPAGRPDPDPMGALTSERMRLILEEACAHFDWVILDAPPMDPMADASILSRMVDGAVFVIRSGQSQYPAVKKAVDALGRERILGVVLNGVSGLKSEHYGYA